MRPGLYKEGIVIDKPVEIVGDGALGDVVIEATGKDVVLFRANMGRITNLTLRQVEGGKWYCIDIAQGRLDVEACDITSQSLACVAIRNGAVRGCAATASTMGKQSGVYVLDNGQGTLEDNEIFANALSGVRSKPAAIPPCAATASTMDKAASIVQDSGQGTLEDNEIFANALSGITIKTGGNPTLRRNRITENKHEAIWVYELGQGVFVENDLRGNAKGAWDIAPECLDKVTRERNQE